MGDKKASAVHLIREDFGYGSVVLVGQPGRVTHVSNGHWIVPIRRVANAATFQGRDVWNLDVRRQAASVLWSRDLRKSGKRFRLTSTARQHFRVDAYVSDDGDVARIQTVYMYRWQIPPVLFGTGPNSFLATVDDDLADADLLIMPVSLGKGVIDGTED